MTYTLAVQTVFQPSNASGTFAFELSREFRAITAELTNRDEFNAEVQNIVTHPSLPDVLFELRPLLTRSGHRLPPRPATSDVLG